MQTKRMCTSVSLLCTRNVYVGVLSVNSELEQFDLYKNFCKWFEPRSISSVVECDHPGWCSSENNSCCWQ